jgi:hypothetical protein
MERGRRKNVPEEMEMGVRDKDRKEIIPCWITTGDFTVDF